MLTYTTEKQIGVISIDEYLANDYVKIDRFLECCKVCPNYEKRWSCPPYDFNPLDYWRQFQKLTVIGVKIIPDDASRSLLSASPEKAETLLEEMRAQERDLLMKELQEWEDAHPGSRLLSVGCCILCKDGCLRAKGKPCAHPDQIRYSIESLGADVDKTTRRVIGTGLQWIAKDKLPDYLMLVGGLLEKE